MNRNLILGAAVALVTALNALPTLAHKVLASAYPSGPAVEGEIGFSNGDMAENVPVEVFDPAGTKLGETTTDTDGAFTFFPSVAVEHHFTADLGAGHKAAFSLSLEEIEQILAMQAEAAETAPQEAGTAPATVITGPLTLSPEDKLAIAEMVRNEVRPVYKELAAYKEHNSLQTILGGIGYIIGLFGIGFYIATRRKSA